MRLSHAIDDEVGGHERVELVAKRLQEAGADEKEVTSGRDRQVKRVSE